MEQEKKKSNYKLKSLAKAAGVKSVFTVGDELIMTGFGKGNDAILEKKIPEARDSVEVLSDPGTYDAKYRERKIRVQGSIKVKNTQSGAMEPIQTALQDNYDSAHMDLIRCRQQLEERYFQGAPFADNIHIQIAYSILNIEKILTPFINNIIYSLNELMREEGNVDFFGHDAHFSTRQTYAEIKNGSSNPAREKELAIARQAFWKYLGEEDSSDAEHRLAYFGEVFYEYDKEQKKWVRTWADIVYSFFALLCDLRNFCTHDADNSEAGRYFPYQLERTLQQETKDALNELFATKAEQLRKEAFTESAGKADIHILLKVFGLENAPMAQKQKLVQEFYDFKVKKSYKNLGFSVKKLREAVLQLSDAKDMASDRYASIRHKLYGHLDFIITKHFVETYHGANLQDNDIFRKLRASRTEKEKDQVYQAEAKPIWVAIRARANCAFRECKSMVSLKPAEKKQLEEMEASLYNGIVSVPKTASLFSELIFLMTYLLDGKEINTLCTSLIHEFDNIDSFNKVLTGIGATVQYQGNYRFFEKAGKVAEELRQVNNMARMSKPLNDVSTQTIMYQEAALLLGATAEQAERENLSKTFNLDNQRVLGYNKKGKPIYDKNFRNFIINNVITSRRFLYLIKYGNPEKIRKVATNPAVIRFVLKDIPDEQIERYYIPCFGQPNGTTPDEMRKKLAERLQKVNFFDFEKVNNQANAEQNKEKARMQAIVRLYLTVPYLFIKNMVNVNARYVLGFHCLERDYALYYREPTKHLKSDDYLTLANDFWKDKDKQYQEIKAEYLADRATGGKKHFHKLYNLEHQVSYLGQDLANAVPYAILQYRNCVAHLSVVSNLQDYLRDLPETFEIQSYFSFYHYCVQCYLKERLATAKAKPTEATAFEKMMADFEKVALTHTYCMDQVKALNASFSYNLPRFKNLSIEALFDKNAIEKEEKSSN